MNCSNTKLLEEIIKNEGKIKPENETNFVVLKRAGGSFAMVCGGLGTGASMN